ncbi:MAG: 2Fe-2S iron-sulfur cluster-binding protein, partial [Bacteroidales bacterium]
MSQQTTITIDNREIQATIGANLLQTARDNGFAIPSLCYHKKLSPTGACRLCVVKVKGIPGMMASCGVKVKEGMEVIAFDPELEDTRRDLLDYLLAEHNEADDGSYPDEFRELVHKYGLDDPANRHFPSIWKELGYPVDDSSQVLTYDASKCIKCFRCIKACDEVQGKNVLSFTNRGITSTIIAGFDHWNGSECDGCGECIQLCPTGAIVEKPHRKEINLKEELKTVRTTCPYCGVGCQLDLVVQNGHIVRSIGTQGVSPNDGRLCVKGRFGYEYINHPDRLT